MGLVKGKNYLNTERNSLLLQTTPFRKRICVLESKQEVTKFVPFKNGSNSSKYIQYPYPIPTPVLLGQRKERTANVIYSDNLIPLILVLQFEQVHGTT